MNTILNLIQNYLELNFVGSPYNFTGVWMGNGFDMASWLGSAAMPALFIETGREYSSPGFAQDQKYRNYTITIHSIVSTTDSNLYRDPNTIYSIYNVTDEIRAALADNKTLGTINDTYRYECFELGDAVEAANPSYLDRSLRCIYRREERWDGSFNNQPTLAPVT